MLVFVGRYFKIHGSAPNVSSTSAIDRKLKIFKRWNKLRTGLVSRPAVFSPVALARHYRCVCVGHRSYSRPFLLVKEH